MFPIYHIKEKEEGERGGDKTKAISFCKK